MFIVRILSEIKLHFSYRSRGSICLTLTSVRPYLVILTSVSNSAPKRDEIYIFTIGNFHIHESILKITSTVPSH